MLSVDHRNPETHHDITRYKRDFADGTKFEKNTYITWRFPNGQRNDRLFIVVNEMRPQLLIPRQNNLTYSWSNDARSWNTVPASGISSTLETLNDEWNRRNVSISLPRLARFFRVNWPDCEWDTQAQRATCRYYYSPTINHFCAANSWALERANVRTCYPRGELNPAPVNPTPKYCSAQMINDYWDFRLNGNAQNLLGAYSSADGSMSRVQLHYPKQGLGQGMRALNVNRPDAYWVESLQTTNVCHDASRFTHLHLEIQARAGFSANVELEAGPGAGRCNERGGPRAQVNLASYAQFTSSEPTKQKIVIPLSDFAGVDPRHLRSIVINNFVNPSHGWVYLDNVAFTGAASPAPIRATPNQATYRFSLLAPNRRLDFGCANPAAHFNNTPAALKFSATVSTPDTHFDIVLRTSAAPGCARGVRETVVSSRDFTRFAEDDAEAPFEFVVPVPADRHIVSMEVEDIWPLGASVVVRDVRLGLAGCVEAADAVRPKYTPKAYPVGGVQRAFTDIFPAPVVG
ncbi:hypothetical protein BCR44DRAFT_1035647 [Catenaria anguillulae PL171]|uniref:Uncharacterized protein n=1 Tax=Catenaria anguillulae PL171 TaxID=765915 RepID=A0A1Y2HSI8_9FUNG|nr:hypothetical protein BCR44DRAFT_1035647 [Catenaria anguillulae PL171]